MKFLNSFMFTFLMLSLSPIFAQIPSFPPSCIAAPGDFTLFGDSRAAQLVGIPPASRFQKTGLQNPAGGKEIQILRSGSINAIQDYGWGGSVTATSPNLRKFDERTGKIRGGDWTAKIADCQAQGAKLITTPKVVISLGGNDVLAAYRYFETQERTYLLYLLLKNPVAFAKAVATEILTGGKAKSPELETWWTWNMEIELNRTTTDMRNIVLYHLNNSPINSVMLTSEAPVLSTEVNGIYSDVIEGKSLTKILRLAVYIGRLEYKYYYDIVKPLFKIYGIRMLFVDSYYRFLQNILSEGASFYLGALPGDGIHFTEEGLKEFTRYISVTMGIAHWFPWSSEVNETILAQYANDPEATMAITPIDFRASEEGIGPLKRFEIPMVKIGLGFKKDFDKISIYYKNPGPDAFAVKGGGILDTYKGVGEATGRLGFPMSNEEGFGPLGYIKKSFFECGVISYNPLNIFHPANIENEGGCPLLSDADQVRDPDFNTCVGGECAARWFEDYVFQLIPLSGISPFHWEVVSGSLPPGARLEANGRLRGAPTNNANGSWSFQVKLTDLQMRSVTKTITFKTGL